jgi:signal transduction histidine kinase
LAVRACAESAAAQTGATLDWQAPECIEHLSPAVEQCAYRVAQESLENVAGHAAAGRVTVRMIQNDGRLTVSISDDGCGFDVSRIANNRLGLKGMQEGPSWSAAH